MAERPVPPTSTQETSPMHELGLLKERGQRTFSLEDYYRQVFCGDQITVYEGPGGHNRNSREYLEWDDQEKRWRKYRWIQEYYYPFDPSSADPISQIGSESTREVKGWLAGINDAIKDKLLLDKKELRDPQRMSPNELLSFIRNQIPEDILIGRLQKKMKSEDKKRNEWVPRHADYLKIDTVVTGWHNKQ